MPNTIESGTTIKVFYSIDNAQTKELSYIVEYYKGETKVENDTEVRTQTVQVLQPDTIEIDRALIENNSKYLGYKLDHTDPATVPNVVNSGTTI